MRGREESEIEPRSGGNKISGIRFQGLGIRDRVSKHPYAPIFTGFSSASLHSTLSGRFFLYCQCSFSGFSAAFFSVMY